MNCSICGTLIEVTSFGWSEGNNAEPINDGRCCDTCDMAVVLPARLEESGWAKEEAQAIGQSFGGG